MPRFNRNDDGFYDKSGTKSFGSKLNNALYRRDINAQEDDNDGILEDFVGPYPCIVAGLEVSLDPINSGKFRVSAGRGWVVNSSWEHRPRRRIVVPADVDNIAPASSSVGAENILVARYIETEGDPVRVDWPMPSGPEDFNTTLTDSYELLCVVGMTGVQDGDIPLGMFRASGFTLDFFECYDHAPYRAALADPPDKHIVPFNLALNSRMQEFSCLDASVMQPDGFSWIGNPPAICHPGGSGRGKHLEVKLEPGQGIQQQIQAPRHYLFSGQIVYLSFRLEGYSPTGDAPITVTLSSGSNSDVRQINLAGVNPDERIWLSVPAESGVGAFGLLVSPGGSNFAHFYLRDIMVHAGNSPNTPFVPTNCYDVDTHYFTRTGSCIGDFAPVNGMTFAVPEDCTAARLRAIAKTAPTSGTSTLKLYVDDVASDLKIDLPSTIAEDASYYPIDLSRGQRIIIKGSHAGMFNTEATDVTAVLELWRWRT